MNIQVVCRDFTSCATFLYIFIEFCNLFTYTYLKHIFYSWIKSINGLKGETLSFLHPYFYLFHLTLYFVSK